MTKFWDVLFRIGPFQNKRFGFIARVVGCVIWFLCVSFVNIGHSQYGSGASVFSPVNSSSTPAIQYGSVTGIAPANSGASSTNLALNFTGGIPFSGGNVASSNYPYSNSGTLIAQTPYTGTTTPYTGTVTYPASTYPASPANVAPVSPLFPTTTPISALPASSSQTVLPAFDPYATSTSPASFFGNPASIFNSAGQSNSSRNGASTSIYSGNFDQFMPETYEAMKRFRDATSFELTWIPRGKDEMGFGITELDLRMQLAIPCRFIPNNGAGQKGPGYFLVAPGGSLVWWDSPSLLGASQNGFSAFLHFGVQPRFNDTFALDAWFRFGAYSDFKQVTSKSMRYQGGIKGIFTVSPTVQVVAGAIYIDRAHYKILPTGGIIWT
ncbi:MAG: hypothetical protein ACRCUY_05360, partial [Thermoguttaceae bacterium]